MSADTTPTKPVFTMQLPAFEEMRACFSAIGCVFNPSEAHGLLAGIMCGNDEYTIQEWLGLLSDEEPIKLSDCSEAEQLLLERVYILTHQVVAELAEDFEVLLPHKDSKLADRSKALGLWCHGFVSGLALTGCYINIDSSQESAEAFQDLIEISRINMSLNGTEEEENAFAEIKSYVQVASMLIYRSLQFIDEDEHLLTASLH